MGAVWRIAFYGLVILIFAYLLFPILVVIPLSFSSGKYLTFPPPGFSLQWYMNFFTRSAWTDSAWLSIWVGLAVTALSTLLGTPAAIGLVRGKFAGKKLVNALILSPVIAPGIIVAIGLYFAYLFHLRKRSFADALIANPAARALHQWWFAGWGFDWIYDKAFVQPFVWVSQINKSDFVDSFYTGVARLTDLLYRGLSHTETGHVRWYAAAMAGGSVLFIAMVLFL